MDTTDPKISFDDEGVCSHCLQFDSVSSKNWHPNETGRQLLQQQVDRIVEECGDAEFNCILGLSGGVDSSYVAVRVRDLGLRPLVVHVDAGWNSELAVNNIEQVVDYCGYELHTHVMDWEEIRDLQLAFLRSGVANQDVVQDHAFLASLYHIAVEADIRYVVSGGNTATESVLPDSWHHSAMDAINLKAIHRQHGAGQLTEFRTISFFDYYVKYPFIKKMRVIRPLNYMPYNKAEALDYLTSEIGYKEYGYKHGESVFTKFFQNHFLIEKYGYDKRKPHLSSLILSEQITRSDALAVLEKPTYEDRRELDRDMEYVSKKLRISCDELQAFIDSPKATYRDYPNWDRHQAVIKSLQSLAARVGISGTNRYS